MQTQASSDLPVSLPVRRARVPYVLGAAIAIGLAGVQLIGVTPRAYVFIGCGLALALIAWGYWRDKDGKLVLTEEGFSYWGTFGERCVRWSDVLGFYRINKTQVGWKYATYFHEHAIARSLSSTLTGVDAGLPEVVGLSMEQQLELMNRLREQYASRDWPVARAVQSTV